MNLTQKETRNQAPPSKGTIFVVLELALPSPNIKQRPKNVQYWTPKSRCLKESASGASERPTRQVPPRLCELLSEAGRISTSSGLGSSIDTLVN